MTHFDDPHQLAGAPVVVGVDGSPGAEIALRWAAGFAARRGRPLQIVHGMNLTGVGAGVGVYAVSVAPAIEAARENGRAVIVQAERVAHEVAPDLAVSAALAGERPATMLIDRSADAYAVVLGATGSAGTLAHLGSTLLAVTAHAHGPVFVIRTAPGQEDVVRTTGPVVVGVDGSGNGERVIASAFAEAADRGTDLVAVHAWGDWASARFIEGYGVALPDDGSEEAEAAVLAESLAGWQEKYPDVTVTRRTYLSDPAEQLQRWSESAQLIVVGSRGRGGFTGLLLGSTANSLVQHAECPVLVVHPAEH